MVRKLSCLLILAGIVLCPFVANAAADFATEGMDDPELDAARHATVPLDSATDALLTAGLVKPVVVITVAGPVDDVVAPIEPPEPRQPRAPPLS